MLLELNTIYEVFKSKATFLTIYVKEAHAMDVWPVNEGLNILTPQTIDDRIQVAKKFIKDTDYKIPVVCDSLIDDFEDKYACWPTRFYMIKDSKMSFIAEPRKATFDLKELEDVLAKNVL